MIQSKRGIPRETPLPSDPSISSSLEPLLLFLFELKIFGIIDCTRRIVQGNETIYIYIYKPLFSFERI
jgi:hypothetical protein